MAEIKKFSPDKGAPGSFVNLICTGFDANSIMVYFYDNQKANSALRKEGGDQLVSAQVPQGASTGKLEVRDNNTSVFTETPFTVVP